MSEAKKIAEIVPLMPVLQYRWRLLVGDYDQNLIARQVTKLQIDYVKMEIAVSIIQPSTDLSLHEYLMEHASKDLPVLIESLNGKGDATSRLEFETTLADHKFVLDYALDDSARHEIIFKIR